jgi:mercuric reductase
VAERYDLVILGSGSTAFGAALRASEMGKTVAMTENRALGGTCVNRGCLPSKNLIEAARLVWEARNPRYPGLAPADVAIDFAALIRQKDEVIADYREKKYTALVREDDAIRVYDGHVRFVDRHAVAVDGTVLEGEQVLIATGSRPFLPAIEGLDETPFLTSDLLTWDQSEQLTALPRSLVIVGGGYIALELGQMFHRFGTQVTILERSRHILSDYEPEISESLEEILREEGVGLVTNAVAERVRQDGDEVRVTARVGGRTREFRAERLLVATGRRPNTDEIGLEAVGVDTNAEGWIAVDEYLRTNVAGVWAAGDVIGQYTDSQLATPVGAADGGLAAANAFSGELRAVDHAVVPRTIFTDPQVAVVGLTDEEANRMGYRCRCNTVPMTVVPRAGAIRDTRGVVKMVLDDETKAVLGVSMLGANAGEVIHEAAMALRFGASVYDFMDLLHVYPTMAEALKIVAVSFFKDVEKLSCCAV